MPVLNSPHPGPSIKQDCLKPLKLTVTQGAKILQITRANLSKIINGHAGVSPEMAIRLEKAGWSTAETWLRMQMAYDLTQAEKKAGKIKVKPYIPKQPELELT